MRSFLKGRAADGQPPARRCAGGSVDALQPWEAGWENPQEAGSEGDGTGETALLWGSSQRALAPERDHDSSSLLRKVLAFKSFTHIVGQR